MITTEEESAQEKDIPAVQVEDKTPECEFPSCKIDCSKHPEIQAPGQSTEPTPNQPSAEESESFDACKVNFKIDERGQIVFGFEDSEACARELGKKDRLRPGDRKYLDLHTHATSK
ncbi:MAG: hypothetical protein ABSE82_08445 [Nitrososphaerales archaeon]|jgi:hypothetical protein